jgi:hypothetical protein
VPRRRDAAWRARVAAAAAAWAAGAAAAPSEWLFPLYRGKCAAKLGAPPAEVLALYAQAARLGRGLLEPLYRLHATRLKLALAAAADGADAHGSAQRAGLRAAAAHPFLADEPAGAVALDADARRRGRGCGARRAAAAVPRAARALLLEHLGGG